MRNVAILVAVFALSWGIFSSPACAQKGMGDPTGVARQAAKPELVSLSGKVVAVETGPCAMTTGRAGIGTHVVVETPEGAKWSVHLGPAAAVKHLADQLTAGREVKVEAFRTENMPEGDCVAKSLAVDGNVTQLRDETLQPVWAGGSALWGGRGGPQPGLGMGLGPARGRGQGNAWGAGWGRGGRGPGYGRGTAQGRGPGYGRGAGWGRGPGYGWGPGQAQGRGAGFGRGWAFVDEDGDGVCDRYETRWGEK